MIELSRGAAFALITSIALALVYHPASGSLVFGPTNRFWIVSPIASVADALAVLVRLGGWAIRKHHLLCFYNEPSRVSKEFSFRNAAYSVLLARSLNASNARRDKYESRKENGSYVEELKSIGLEIDEGKRCRLGIALPILAQFVKILAMRYVYFVKVLGCVYFSHWLIIEVLIVLAKPRRRDNFTAPETSDIFTRLDELLFLSEHRVNDAERNMQHQVDIEAPSVNDKHNTMVDEVFQEIYAWLAPVSYIPFVCLIPYCKPALFLRYTAMYPVWVIGMLYVCGRGTSHASHNVGGDIGTVFFATWVVWCILCFDGEGTQRPSWPWLDWLG